MCGWVQHLDDVAETFNELPDSRIPRARGNPEMTGQTKATNHARALAAYPATIRGAIEGTKPITVK